MAKHQYRNRYILVLYPLLELFRSCLTDTPAVLHVIITDSVNIIHGGSVGVFPLIDLSGLITAFTFDQIVLIVHIRVVIRPDNGYLLFFDRAENIANLYTTSRIQIPKKESQETVLFYSDLPACVHQ